MADNMFLLKIDLNLVVFSCHSKSLPSTRTGILSFFKFSDVQLNVASHGLNLTSSVMDPGFPRR